MLLLALAIFSAKLVIAIHDFYNDSGAVHSMYDNFIVSTRKRNKHLQAKQITRCNYVSSLSVDPSSAFYSCWQLFFSFVFIDL